MDILRPPIVRVGGRCYRKNPVLQRDSNTAEEEEEFIASETAAWNENEDEACDLNSNIEKTLDGYKVSLAVPSSLFKFVIGKKGETRRRLETETRTQIRIPRQGQEGDIVIQGHDRNGVLSAKTRLDVLLDSARQKQPFTHFLSIPVTVDHIKGSLADFMSDVLRECDGDRGLDNTIFQNPDRLHLTIGCLVLLDETEVASARQVLQDCEEQLIQPILKGEPLVVDVRGLEYMNDDPAEVDVLYAKIADPSDRLQILVDRLVDKFTSAGLMQREFDRVKLHVTVMNTVFRKDPVAATEPHSRVDRGPRRPPRESFYASSLLKKFGDYRFGEFRVGTVHISQRHSSGKDGYYSCAGSVNLP